MASIEPPAIVWEIAEMIADFYGRSVIDPDLDLAAQILNRVTGINEDGPPTYREPTYGWHTDDRA